jgi:hypothetical protein
MAIAEKQGYCPASKQKLQYISYVTIVQAKGVREVTVGRGECKMRSCVMFGLRFKN